jgi:hypothetical protein
MPSALVICLGEYEHVAIELPHTSSESEDHGGSHADWPLSVSDDAQPFVSGLGPAPQGSFSALTIGVSSITTGPECSKPLILLRYFSTRVPYPASLKTVSLRI